MEKELKRLLKDIMLKLSQYHNKWEEAAFSTASGQGATESTNSQGRKKSG